MVIAGKKGKETPIPDNMAGAITIPTKPPTKMKKRGEEDLEAKYLSKSNYCCQPLSW